MYLFILFGCFIQFALLLSVFDIYYTSPIVKDATPFEPIHEPLADRVVMIVTDGMRADSFINYTAMPYLKSVASEKGMWGISHTRVPTESRTCHIAMLAGFYEDPSAVTKAWYHNAIDFDSVFNRSAYSWCWGVPSIIDIFSKAFVGDHIFIQPFDTMTLFSTNAPSEDVKILNNVKMFFAKGKNDTELNKKLNTRKIVFFVNLNGPDTAGHVHRPNTNKFFEKMAYTDYAIKELEILIKDFYNDDGRTTFLVTADHGMSNWGSHGGGSIDETRTPFVVWGSGVKKSPLEPRGNSTHLLPQDSLEPRGNSSFKLPQGFLEPRGNSSLKLPQGFLKPRGNSSLKLPPGSLESRGNSSLKLPQATLEPRGNSSLELPQATLEPRGNSSLKLPQATLEPRGNSFLKLPQATLEPLGNSSLKLPEGSLVSRGNSTLGLPQGSLEPRGNSTQQLPQGSLESRGNSTFELPQGFLERCRNSTPELPQDRRYDIEQNAIAPLLSTILAIPVPVNSIGYLPDELLNLTIADRAKALYGNSRQLGEQYEKKRANFMAHVIKYLYKPYKSNEDRLFKAMIISALSYLEKQAYDPLIIHSKYLRDFSMAGLKYYHNYYQTPLLVVVTLIFIGWILYLVTTLLLDISSQSARTEDGKTRKYGNDKAITAAIDIVFAFLAILSITLLFIQSLPLQYYIYFTLPVILWWLILRNYRAWIAVIAPRSKLDLLSIAIKALCYILGSLTLGLSFTYRWMLSIPLVGMALWPFVSSSRRHIPLSLLVMWPICCLLLSIFTFLPVVGGEVCISLVILAGISEICAMLLSKDAVKKAHAFKQNKSELILVTSQVFVLLMALINIFVQSRRFALGTPVNYWMQAEAWFISVLAFLLPLCHTTRMMSRLSAINLAVLTFYLFLSVAHEGIFLIVFTFTLTTWIKMEYAIYHEGLKGIYKMNFDSEMSSTAEEQELKKRCVDQQDFRRAFFVVVYLTVSFFGTGNIASLNSFEVRWVTCFVTTYRPVMIGCLVFMKTFSPFMCVACSLRAIQLFTKAPLGLLNIIVLIYSNIIGLKFLFYLKNEGTWVEIGTSLSHYVIVEIITLFIVMFDQVANILTKGSYKSIYKLIAKRNKHVPNEELQMDRLH